ncbi:uncharacterized protein METZ01_LOCUS74252, partial [marine metagenome]
LYGVSGIPHVEFGGTISLVGGGGNMYPTYLNIYNSLLGDHSPLIINQFVNTIENDIVISADVEVTDHITTSNNKILFVLVRYQDSDYFSSVIAYQESSFNLTDVGETGNFESSITIDPEWDLELVKAVVMVQSWSSNQILQVDMAEINLENYFSINCSLGNILSDDDSDGLANPGETLTVSLRVNNESLVIDADNLSGFLSSENLDVTINQESLYFGDITNGDMASGEVEIVLAPDIVLGDVLLTLTISSGYTDNYGNEFEYSYDFPLFLNVNLNQAGWPFENTTQIESSPAVLDIDGDGTKEVIFGDYSGSLHVVSSIGAELPGFPFELGNDIWGSPAVADLEGDGDV